MSIARSLLTGTTQSTNEPHLHQPERGDNETFAAYRARRSASNKVNRNAQRNPNHGLVGSRTQQRDDMRKSGTMSVRLRAYVALMAASASKRIPKTTRRDEKGSYTLTGRHLPVYGMNAWDRDRIVAWTPGRRVWVAGISARA